MTFYILLAAIVVPIISVIAQALWPRVLPGKPYDFPPAFRYKRGVVFWDGWRRINEGSGDCDDYALTVAIRACGGWLPFILSMIVGRVNFWRVKSVSNGTWPRHVAVHIWGRGWTDSTYQSMGYKEGVHPHKLRWPIIWPWVILMILLGFVYSSIKRVARP